MNILTAIAFTPLAGTLVLFFFPRRSVFAARITALAASGLAATLAAAALFLFSAQDGGFQFAEQFHFIGMKSSFLVASDGLGVLALALVNAIAFLSALFPFDPEDRRKEYYFWLLFSQAMFTGIIVSGDLLSFSGFWFLSVLPVYFLTSLCAERAALRYFLPQFAGAVLMLAAVTAVQLQAGKGGLVIAETASGFKLWAVGFMVLSIIIRIPVFPFNLWMKDFYMQTPGHLSALIAGSSAVTSLYAAQKLLIPIMKSGVAEFAPGVMILAAFSALYAAVMILPQKNLKMAAVYFSMFTSGLCLMGLASLNGIGITGAGLGMIVFPPASAAMLFLAEFYAAKFKTASYANNCGLLEIMPVFSGMLCLCAGALAAMPFSGGFVAAFMIIAGAFKMSGQITALAVAALLTAACAAAGIVAKLVWGKFVSQPPSENSPAGGLAAACPLLALAFAAGIFPGFFLKYVSCTVNMLQSFIKVL